MHYWWVNHTMTFKAESEGGYIWSPKTKRNGDANKSYENLTKVEPGDVIFSYAKSHLRAVGFATSRSVTTPKPKYRAPGAESWSKTGWHVRVEWIALDHPVRPRDHMAVLGPLLPSTHSPIQLTGKGNQGSYLASLTDELAKAVLALIDAKNRGVIADMPDCVSFAIEESIDRAAQRKEGASTERMQISLAREGQGLFRRRVLDIEQRCRVTGVSDAGLLIASHIKPWKMSDDTERLDGENGLLLSPHVDKLFDRGHITFGGDGRVLHANDRIRRVMQDWGLNPDLRISKLRAEQERYMAFHREHVFNKPSL